MSKFEQIRPSEGNPLASKAGEIFRQETEREKALALERAKQQQGKIRGRMDSLKAKAGEEKELDLSSVLDEAEIEEGVENLFKSPKKAPEEPDKKQAA